jgi:hypothetical protein
MNSLREEIKEILIKDGYKGNQEYYLSDDELVGLIISEIDRRIDKFIIKERKLPYAEQDEVISGIEELRKELLE